MTSAPYECKVIGPAPAGRVASDMSAATKEGWTYVDTIYSGIWGSDQYLKIAVLLRRPTENEEGTIRRALNKLLGPRYRVVSTYRDDHLLAHLVGTLAEFRSGPKVTVEHR